MEILSSEMCKQCIQTSILSRKVKSCLSLERNPSTFPSYNLRNVMLLHYVLQYLLRKEVTEEKIQKKFKHVTKIYTKQKRPVQKTNQLTSMNKHKRLSGGLRGFLLTPFSWVGKVGPQQA